MNELFFHECRAAGLVFKTVSDWTDWLKENKSDSNNPVACHDGFKYNIHDVCQPTRHGAQGRHWFILCSEDSQDPVRMDLGLRHQPFQQRKRQPSMLSEPIRQIGNLLRDGKAGEVRCSELHHTTDGGQEAAGQGNQSTCIDCQEGAHEHHPSVDGTIRGGGGETKKAASIQEVIKAIDRRLGF